LDQRIALLGITHIEHAPADLLRALLRRGRSDHLRALFRQFGGDRRADAARCAGDEGELAIEGIHFASAFSIEARSLSELVWISRSMRFTMPARALPGPHSRICVTPCARMARIVSTQRTGEDAW